MIFQNQHPERYRPCVGIMVINQEGKIFLGQRGDQKSLTNWQMPQGGIEENEEPLQAAYRELKEETGMDQVELISSFPQSQWLYYDLPQEYVPASWNGRYDGQKQKWFLMKYMGKGDDIDLGGSDGEFKNWCWATKAETLNRVVFFKREIYQSVMKAFQSHE